MELRRSFDREPGSARAIGTYYQRPVGIDDVSPRTRGISVLFTFEKSETPQQRFLRPNFSKPAFGSHTSRLDAKLPR